MTKQETLKKYFGYDSFREGQEFMIDNILAGRDVLGIMPTGAGKSLCYQVPALLLPGITIVVSPLISLMNDQVRALNDAGVHAAYINSTLSDTQVSKALGYAAMGRYKIIYVAPERLETYAFQRFVGALERAADHSLEISMVTVDEAHCISQWGQDFRPSYLKILDFVKGLKKRPVMSAFTATATREVKEDILCVLGLREPKVLVTGFDRQNLFFSVEHVKNKDQFIQEYLQEHREESGIIYCATRKNVDKLYEDLKAQGFPVAEYHAGLSNEARKANQDDFIYDRKSVIIATNAFGMGIDKSNVRYVLHYNMPQSLENYYQEAGRAGRDGGASECILLYSPQDIMINRFLIENKDEVELGEEEKEALRERDEMRLRSMTTYCTTTRCLREYILHYFGEMGATSCGNCSNCTREYEEEDVTKAARQIVGCIRELRQRFGINVVVGTLRGRDNAKLRSYNLQQCSTYGCLQEMAEEKIKAIINVLLQEDFIRLTVDKYALVKLTPQGYDFLEGRSMAGRGKGQTGKNQAEESQIRKSQDGNYQVGQGQAKEAQAKESQTEKKQTKEFRLWMRSLKQEKIPAKGPEKQAKSKVGKGHLSETLTSRGMDLFDKLRELRRQIAKAEGKPPYIVFSDKTLLDMCIKTPLDKDGMLAVNGVGENKYLRYGGQFLAEIQKFTGGRKEKLYY